VDVDKDYQINIENHLKPRSRTPHISDLGVRQRPRSAQGWCLSSMDGEREVPHPVRFIIWGGIFVFDFKLTTRLSLHDFLGSAENLFLLSQICSSGHVGLVGRKPLFVCGLVIIDLGPRTSQSSARDDFARWPGAYAACETLSRGETLVNATAMVHTLTGLTLRPEHRWHFMQVGLPRLELKPLNSELCLELKHGDLHGLLGHRALLPGPTTTPSTVRVGVGVDGAAAPRAFGPAFGPQGEGGRSKGTWALHRLREERPRLHEHGGRRFGRFACGAGCNRSLSLCLVLRVLVLSFRIW
jgi:hypothetical protein